MYGCAGVVRLLSGYYLVVLTSCCFVERILGRAVFKATNFGIIRCSAPGSFHAMSKQHKRDEARYLHLLRASLVANTKHLYFVHGHDMSRNCQSQYLLCRPRCSIRATLKTWTAASLLHKHIVHRMQLHIPGRTEVRWECHR